jgi:DnaJ-class molecular chaperone
MATSTRDYYQLLGVKRDGSGKDIRAAYRRLARQYHPDLNPGEEQAESRFKEIQRAYEVLSDPEKRKKYDQFGPMWEQIEAGSGPPPGFDQGFRNSQFDFGGFGRRDSSGGIFDDLLFNNMGARFESRRGQDLEQATDVSLEEAYHGTTRLIAVEGTGVGRRRLEVRVPAGVKTGSRVRVAGEGQSGIAGGARGDLYLIVNVLPHERFERQGEDLYFNVSVPLYDAILGGAVSITLISGRQIELKIPAGTSNGQLIRLGGQGMPRLNHSGHGDGFGRASVVLPVSLSDREKELFATLRELRI